jgi:glycosyltransferase involved in cell wall biosynthesis
MIALFVHDHWFSVTPSGSVYTSGKLPYPTWQRYLKVFDELVVVGRSRLISETQTSFLDLSSGDRVSFIFVPNLASPWIFFRNLVEVLDTLKDQIEKSDAVIARTSLLGEMAAFMARKMGKPLAIEAVGDAWDAYWNYGGSFSKLCAPLAWLMMKYCLRNADFAIYVTHEYLQRRYPCRGFFSGVSDVHINAVDKSVLDHKIARWRSSETLGSSRVLKIGFIGSLVNRYKGLNVALQALKRLKDIDIQFELRVLGNGNQEQWHQEAKQLRVSHLMHLDGVLPSGEAVIQWLDEVDVYIQPSFQEGLPRALIEAMSRGLPALGSTCGGIPELLPAECLHRPGDDKVLAEQLARMAKDPAWAILQAERNFHEAKNYYHEELNSRRSKFWEKFAEAVRDRK